MAASKKNAARLGAYIVFVDESGFLLIPTVRKTWAPKGATPKVRHSYRRERISVISGISIAPDRRHVGLYFQCYRHNIKHGEVCAFLEHLLRHLACKHVIVIWDNASIHKGDPIRELCARYPRLHLELLPPYAPELDPDEQVWSFAKGELANGRPDDIDELYEEVTRALRKLQRSQRRLRACIHRADLPPILS